MKIIFRFFLFTVLILVLLSLFVGCATIIHGTKQPISINSSPDQGDIVVTREGGVVVFNGKTPTTCELQRKFEYDVTINLAGYQESKIHISKEFDAIYLGNILCGGIIGLIIDASNGAMYKLAPETINVTLITASIDGANGIISVFN